MKVLVIGGGGHVSKVLEMAAELKENRDGFLIVQHNKEETQVVTTKIALMGRASPSRGISKTLALAMHLTELQSKGYTITTLEQSRDFGVPAKIIDELTELDSCTKPKRVSSLEFLTHEDLRNSGLSSKPEPIPYTIKPLQRFDGPPTDKHGKFLTNPGSKYHK